MSTQPVPRSTVTCPRCQGVLDPADDVDGWVTCARCGHRAATAHVVDLVTVEEYLLGASAHRAWLLDRVAAGDAAPARATAYRGAAQTAASPTSDGSTSTATQTLLLTAGGVLIALAGLFFASVAWGYLGGSGKVVLLGTVGALLAFGGYRGRSRVPAAAQTLTAVGAALIATAVYGAPALGAVPDSVFGGHIERWVTIASVVLLLGYGAGLALTRLRAWLHAAAAAVTAAAVSLGLHLADRNDDPLHFTATTALGGVLAVASVQFARRTPVGTAVRTWAAPDLSTHLRWCRRAVTGLLLAAAATSLLLWFVPAQQDRFAPYIVAASVLGSVSYGIGRLMPRPYLGSLPEIWAGVLWGSAVGLFLTWLAPDTAPGVVHAVLAAIVLVLASMWARMGVAWPALAGTVWVGGLMMPEAAGADPTAATVAVVLAITAVALYVAALRGRSAGWALLAWPGGVSAVIAWCTWWEDRQQSRQGAREPAGSQSFDQIEMYTGPSAVFLLAAGLLWAWRRHSRTGSFPNSALVLLPGLLTVVVPGGWAAVDLSYGFADDVASDSVALFRSVAYLLGGAALIVAGARFRLSGLVIAGTVGAGLATLGHLGAVGDALPRWVSLAAAGTLLLVVGVRWEWLSRQKSPARTWVGTLR